MKVKPPRPRPRPGPWPWLQAVWDWTLRPGLKDPYGGPFNGQAHRRALFLQLLEAFPFQVLVETGTFRGATTRFLADASGRPVFTVDAHPRYYHYARLRFRRRPDITVEAGDSRRFLERLARAPAVPREDVFFYLDAHWQADLPLREELEIVCRSWTDSVIMVDDFRVPGDDGYIYDNYGEGRELSLEYLESLVPGRLDAFFPSLSSEQETGKRRGCVVLASGEPAARRLRALSSLRPG
ncbi:MAG: class I SAM-dependent methyltransferase [bacterium]|nr:class I SAM-dependent methyltransferase [bacterium]